MHYVSRQAFTWGGGDLICISTALKSPTSPTGKFDSNAEGFLFFFKSWVNDKGFCSGKGADMI